MRIMQFVDEGLGNAAHLVVAERSGVAALVDPLRDVDRYVAAATQAGVAITHVFETHLHNDFVSGARELVERHGARLYASAAGGLGHPHTPLRDGDDVMVGEIAVRVLATPGHTPEHLAFLARDTADGAAPPALFSGGSLLVGSVSRTDLLGHEHATGLARALFHSLQDRVLPLPDDVQVYPTHGAGSFCNAAPSGDRSTTLGRERATNPFLSYTDADSFVTAALHSLSSYPSYFTHMRAINQAGPRVLGGVPALDPLPPIAVQQRLQAGEALLDIRPVGQYVQAHVPGSYHSEHRAGFASWVGWVVPFGTPLIILTHDLAVLDDAVRQLIRIGYDRLAGYLEGGLAAWERAGLPLASFPVLSVAELRARIERSDPLVVLDVRQDEEWQRGHIPGALHVEVGRLPADGTALPAGRPIAVHCGHAPRAATALSVLERQGRTGLHLVQGGFGAWEAAAFPIAIPSRG